jgi:ATP-dependent helicase/nuclease subunit A
MSLLSQETFLGQQKDAVFSDSAAIAVTAGAGSGKTRSLVGRYLRLLERGYPLRSILAITFTEKAAREMRSRIRSALADIQHSASPALHPQRGASVSVLHSEIDSARISTIHSLCAEILRQYPAEAGLDPAFNMLEEGLAAALKAEAIDSALAWAAEDPEAVQLFGFLKESEIRQALGILLERRLDVQNLDADFREYDGENQKENIRETPLTPRPMVFETHLQYYLAQHLDSPAWLDPLADLSSYAAKSPDDKLELARREVLAHWDEARMAFAAKNWDVLLAKLAALRKAIDTRGGRKSDWDESDLAAVRESMGALKNCYEENLKFLAEKARFALDEQVAAHLPQLLRLLEQVLLEYQRRKDERQALDFDDLEGRAARLLTEHPTVRASLQTDLRAVLVDEFQDTNERQRQIVYALTGFNSKDLTAKSAENAKENLLNLGDLGGLCGSQNPNEVDLFIVGDSKQSIYKFRGADVSVFRQVQSDVQASGGQHIDLDLTFRAHQELLETLNRLLAPILGETDDPARPHLVPFAPLRAHREKPVRNEIQPPYVEIHLGLGENAEEGRQIASAALANRLLELHQTEKFAWGDVALLFRASSAFPAYETALETAGIPFVTVAGRGFYDRPEIRDLLNMLAAIADPADDLALVGLLRSPAFAIPDAEIYQLRFPNQASQPAKLMESLHAASIQHSSFSIQPLLVIEELRAIASRASAAAVLKRLLDLTGYRAILSTAPNGARMLRNVEKLLADAHRSRLTSLPAFLAYIRTLRDVGLREGEAPADAQTSGAVQLMTVHKSKGLEFPLTILADASYEPRPRSAKVQLSPPNLLLDIKDGDYHPTAWQIAARLADELDDAEDRRLLYVAATRASEKLIISGHVKAKKDGFLTIPGWLGRLGLEQIKIPVEMPTPQHTPLINELGITVMLYPVKPADTDSPPPASVSQPESPRKSDLLEPITPASPITDEKARTHESDPPQRVWRIVPDTKRPHAPAWVVGKLVHESLRRWKFPGDGFDDFLHPFTLESGLTDLGEISAAIHETRRLLEHFRAHPLYTELDQAERHHEIPYYTPAGRGIIDLLYHAADGWVIIDFKTDRADSEEQARALIRQNEYDTQLARYVLAVKNQLNVIPRARLIFLNVKSHPVLFDL